MLKLETGIHLRSLSAEKASYSFWRRYLHARAQSLQVSKVQTLPAGIQTLHHAVRLHAARTHRHA